MISSALPHSTRGRIDLHRLGACFGVVGVMDEDSRVTIDYLRELPEGATVHWSSHHVSASRPWTAGWIDIRIEDEGAPDFSWVWTILGEDDTDGTGPDQLWQFAWPYDLDVHEVWHPDEGLVDEWRTPRRVSASRDRRQQAIPGARDLVLGGWSVETIGKALSAWSTRHAGRPDLRFEWDPESEPHPAVAVAAERARATAEGAPVWDLGEGLTVADGFMDELLAMDPAEHDEVMRVLRETQSGPADAGDNAPAD
jgi:hypothetical protein